MFCPKCGKRVSDQATQCVYCGEKVVPITVPSHFCTNCGNKNEENAVICRQCGGSLAVNGNWAGGKPLHFLYLMVGAVVFGLLSGVLAAGGVSLGGIPAAMLLFGCFTASEAIFAGIRKSKADKANASRHLYASMSCNDRTAALSEKLQKTGAPSGTAEIVSRLYEDTFFGELKVGDQEQMKSNKAVMSFLRKNGIDINAYRRYGKPGTRTETPGARNCPRCGGENYRQDNYCFYCSNPLVN